MTLKTAEFISKALEVHNGRYSYAKSVYVNARTKISIGCKVHGQFFQRPSSHLKGYGCKKCAIEHTASIKLQKRINLICPTCETSFSIPESERKKNRKYCSRRCVPGTLTAYQSCAACGTEFKKKRRSSKYCSIDCTTKANTFSKEQVIKKFEKKHGDRFSYTKMHYKGMYKPITITCKVHGDFELLPIRHITGTICNECRLVERELAIKLKRNLFIENTSAIQNAALSNLSFEVVKQTCMNCNKSYISRKANTTSFCSKRCSSSYYGRKRSESSVPIESSIKAKMEAIYGSKLSFISMDQKSPRLHRIHCSCVRHGQFTITIEALLAGADCHFCADRKVNKKRFLERVKESESINSDKYDYSKINEFSGIESQQTFVCKTHGDFKQSIAAHLRGEECRKCAIEKRATHNLDRSKERWPKNAIKIHGNKYDYSNSVYQGAKKLTEIICKQHGSFFQIPNNHINGAGCPVCADEFRSLGDTVYELQKAGRNPDGKLYVLECFREDEHFFKVGITTRSVDLRYQNQTAMPYDFFSILEIELGLINSYLQEQRILERLADFAYKPKIYFAGETECLLVNPCEEDSDFKTFLNSEYNKAALSNQ